MAYPNICGCKCGKPERISAQLQQYAREPIQRLDGGTQVTHCCSSTRSQNTCRIWLRMSMADHSGIPVRPAYDLYVSITYSTLGAQKDALLAVVGRNLDSMCWGEPLSWHSFFGHSFRFRKSVLVSPSRRRGLGKGTAFESLSPAVL